MDLQNENTEVETIVDNQQPESQGTQVPGIEGQENQQNNQDQDLDPRKKGYQKRINQITWEKNEAIRKAEKIERELEAERALNRALAQNKSGTEAPATGTQSDEELLNAFIDEKVQKRLEQEQIKAKQQQVEQSWEQKLDSVRQRHEDFDEVIMENLYGVPVHDLVMDEIKSSDLGEEVLYHLAKNPNELKTFQNLSVSAQIRYIGKLEGKLESTQSLNNSNNKPKQNNEPIKPKPDPIKPIVANTSTIAKDLRKMSMEEHAMDYYNKL